MLSAGNALRSIRNAAIAAADATGVSGLVARSRWRTNRLLILCYHGVSLADEHRWHRDLFVTPAFLRRRFEIIRQVGCSVLPLGEAVLRLQQGTLPKLSVAITFDDGFYDFHAAALPVLREFAIPAMIYVSTYHCQQQRPILGLTVPYLLWKYSVQPGPNTRNLDASPPYGALTHITDRKAAADALLAECRKLAPDRDAQMAWLAGLAGRLGVDWAALNRQRLLHLMTSEEVADIARQGITVALHTHRHRTPRNAQAFAEEITTNQSIIQALTGQISDDFCYPSGVVHPEFLGWERDLGIETATTCIPGLAQPGCNPLLLPRFIDTMSQSEQQFTGWLTGVSQLVSRSRDVYADPAA